MIQPEYSPCRFRNQEAMLRDKPRVEAPCALLLLHLLASGGRQTSMMKGLIASVSLENVIAQMTTYILSSVKLAQARRAIDRLSLPLAFRDEGGKQVTCTATNYTPCFGVEVRSWFDKPLLLMQLLKLLCGLKAGRA